MSAKVKALCAVKGGVGAASVCRGHFATANAGTVGSLLTVRIKTISSPAQEKECNYIY